MKDNVDGVSTRSLMDWQLPYPGQKAFTEDHAAFFYGRRAEESELLRMVKRLVLIKCFGASVLGKTSLLGGACSRCFGTHSSIRCHATGFLPVAPI